MGISERKEREKQEMRKNIIDAAMHMFVEDGYENASIRKIADKIEYSPATIYLYYKDKDELLYDVQAECFGMLSFLFRKEVTATEPLERLEQICYSYVSFGLKNPELYDLMFIIKSPMNVLEEENRQWDNGDDAFQFLLDCITECMEAGHLRFSNPKLGALSVWAMGHGLVSLNIRCRMKLVELANADVNEVITAAITEYLRLIKT